MKRIARICVCGPSALALSCAVFAAAAAAQQASPAPRREQTPQVLARYGAVDLPLDTPALVAGRTTYTTQAELEDYVAKLPAGRIAKLSLGSISPMEASMIPLRSGGSAGRWSG
jgi:hypothetical protein